MKIPPNYPVVGKDAFRTATGVHAAAIIKAQKRGDSWANNVYSGVDASLFGMKQEINIGHFFQQKTIVTPVRYQVILNKCFLIQVL